MYSKYFEGKLKFFLPLRLISDGKNLYFRLIFFILKFRSRKIFKASISSSYNFHLKYIWLQAGSVLTNGEMSLDYQTYTYGFVFGFNDPLIINGSQTIKFQNLDETVACSQTYAYQRQWSIWVLKLSLDPFSLLLNDWNIRPVSGEPLPKKKYFSEIPISHCAFW